jgi:hypothetical protein
MGYAVPSYTKEIGYNSQIGQDEWVDGVLGKKHGGTFLDVGCGHWERISNSLFFERYRGWSGVAIDINEDYRDDWERNRPASHFIAADATTVHYESVLDHLGMPYVIDYLSIDLEPPNLSLPALFRVFESSRVFRCITFETDAYRYKGNVEPSRQFLADSGYKLAQPGQQDDFWVLKV